MRCRFGYARRKKGSAARIESWIFGGFFLFVYIEKEVERERLWGIESWEGKAWAAKGVFVVGYVRKFFFFSQRQGKRNTSFSRKVLLSRSVFLLFFSSHSSSTPNLSHTYTPHSSVPRLLFVLTRMRMWSKRERGGEKILCDSRS